MLIILIWITKKFSSSVQVHASVNFLIQFRFSSGAKISPVHMGSYQFEIKQNNDSSKNAFFSLTHKFI